MDKPVHEVRLSNWIKIVSACQSRPKGVTQKQWISENGMTRNQYYYWQRKVRNAVYLEQHSDLPQSVTSNTTPVAFVEFPSDAENLKGPTLQIPGRESHVHGVLEPLSRSFRATFTE